MAVAAGSLSPTARAASVGRRSISVWRKAAVAIVVLLAVLLIWEAAKWLGGDPWFIHGTVFGVRIDYEHRPPLQWRIADDLSLPHVWDVTRAFVDPAQRNGPPLGLVLSGQALFTFREALVGFVFGGILGLGLAVWFVHSQLAERALVPYVVASQTVPILAISPIVVNATKAGWLSVANCTRSRPKLGTCGAGTRKPAGPLVARCRASGPKAMRRPFFRPRPGRADAPAGPTPPHGARSSCDFGCRHPCRISSRPCESPRPRR